MSINPVSERMTQQIHMFFFLNDKILKFIDDGLMNGMVFIDPQKALDPIKHNILLRKLSIVNVNVSNIIYQIEFRELGSDNFLTYITDMLIAIKYNLFLYAYMHCWFSIVRMLK